MYLAAVKTAQS